MVIDFEHHYIPVELARRLGMKTDGKVPVKQGDASVHAQLFDMQAQLEEMGRAGVDTAVSSCILGWETTLDNCRLINDATAQLQKDYPGRFVGLAHVPPLDGEAALSELERAVGRRVGAKRRDDLFAGQRSVAAPTPRWVKTPTASANISKQFETCRWMRKSLTACSPARRRAC